MSRQSDYPIVSMKSMKVDGEKGIEGKAWGRKGYIRHTQRWRWNGNET